MEREEKRTPARRSSGNGGVVILLLLLLVIGIGELALLLLQKKQLDELSVESEDMTEELAQAQQEAEELRIQADAYKDERDAALAQIGGAPAAAPVTSAESGTAEVPPQEVQPDGEPSGEDEEGDNDDEVEYAIVEDVNRVYQDIRYQQFAKENDPYDTKQYTYSVMYSYPTDVVFLGDSITERCSWNELFPDLNVKNRGIGGDTVNGVLARLDTVMKTEPKKIFLMVGVNNLMNHNSVDEIIEDYGVLLDELEELDCKVYVESILPAGAALRDASRVILEGREVNAAVKEMCEDRGITYIDLTDAFSNEDLGLKNEYDYDGVHINASGYRRLRSILEEYVYEEIE